MTSDSGRHAQRGDVQQAPPEGCQSVIAQRIPTSSPIGTDQELIDYLRNEGRARNRHEGPNARLHKCELAADALQSRISEVERLREALAMSTAEMERTRSEIARHKMFPRRWASLGKQCDFNRAALSQQGKV